MKKSFVFLSATLLLIGSGALTSCISSQSFMPVKGNGMAVDKTFNVSDFHQIDVSGGFDVILSQGSNEQVVLSAQENLYKYIHVEVVGGVLKIFTEGNLMPTKSMKAKIFIKEIDHLGVSGGGDVTAETDLNVKNLNIEISGGGDLSANVSTGELICRISGGGDVNLNGKAELYNFTLTGGGDLQSQIEATEISCTISGGGDLMLKSPKQSSRINIDLNGGGDAQAEVITSSLKSSLSGGGTATFSGTANNLEVQLSGGGDLKASDLKANSITFQANGGSDIYIFATDQITGNISGGGDVYYSGSAETVSIDARGGSEVHKQ